jgi:tetratricopeptide (TPR) repeat protein
MPHLSLDVATMVLEGELPPRVLVRILYDHLKELCPVCREALEAVQGLPARRLEAPRAAHAPSCPEQYHATIAGAGARLAERLRSVEAERRAARRDLATLSGLPAERREARVAAARTRFRSRALAELLIEASRETVRREPREAAALAGLAALVAERLVGAEAAAAPALGILAIAHRANAERVAGDMPAADRAFARVRERLATAAVDDPGLHADVCSLEASLRIAQRRFDDAADLLDRAILLSRMGRDERTLARVLIQRADVHGESEEASLAIECLREALTLLDATSDRHLFACAIGTLTLLECERGSFTAAGELLCRHRALFEDGTTWWQVRVLVMEGRVAHGLGRMAEAEERLRTARRLCEAEGMEIDAASMALELAVLCAEQGRMDEVRRIAAEVQPSFALREVHREATAALLLFQRAVAGERVNVEALRSIRDVVCRRRRGLRSGSEERPS